MALSPVKRRRETITVQAPQPPSPQPNLSPSNQTSVGSSTVFLPAGRPALYAASHLRENKTFEKRLSDAAIADMMLLSL